MTGKHRFTGIEHDLPPVVILGKDVILTDLLHGETVAVGQVHRRIVFCDTDTVAGSSGRLLVVDVGGGSLEIAAGIDEEPDAVTSLPLGANRLTRDWFADIPPTTHEVKELRTYVRSQVASIVREVVKVGEPDVVVGTSKTLRSLARVGGAAPSSAGLYERRSLSRETLLEWLPRLAEMTGDELAELPGVSASRARQLAAGAIVADAVLDLFGAESLEICPWALREGVILRRPDWITGT